MVLVDFPLVNVLFTVMALWKLASDLPANGCMCLIEKKRSGSLRFIERLSEHIQNWPQETTANPSVTTDRDLAGLAKEFGAHASLLRSTAKGLQDELEARPSLAREGIDALPDLYVELADVLEKGERALCSKGTSAAQKIAEVEAHAPLIAHNLTSTCVLESLVFRPEITRTRILDMLSRGPGDNGFDLLKGTLLHPEYRGNLIRADMFYDGLATLLKHGHIDAAHPIFKQEGVVCKALFYAVKEAQCSKEVADAIADLCKGAAKIVAGVKVNSALVRGAGKSLGGMRA